MSKILSRCRESLEPVLSLPKFCTQPNTELAYLYNNEGHFIAYEKHRDFLSAPRCFVVLKYPPDCIAVINDCSFVTVQLDLHCEEYAVYEYDTDDSRNMIFYGETSIVEITSTEYEIKTIYHVTSSFEAIVKYLELEA